MLCEEVEPITCPRTNCRVFLVITAIERGDRIGRIARHKLGACGSPQPSDPYELEKMAKFSGESSKEGAAGGQNGTGMEANAAPLPVTWQFEYGGEGEVSPSCAPNPSLEPATARGACHKHAPRRWIWFSEGAPRVLC